jgi:Na+-driven multidrug efflux pump
MSVFPGGAAGAAWATTFALYTGCGAILVVLHCKAGRQLRI